MAPTASAEEIRAAYRRQARRLHPDVGQRGSATEMSALNEAWRVLGDPVRRRRYDEALRSAPAAGSWSPAPSAPDADDEEVLERPAGRAGYLAGLPWLLVLVALVVIFVFTAYATGRGGGGDADQRDGLVRPGDCVRLRTGHPAAETACTDDHDAVVAAVVPSGACPGGTEPALGPVGSPRLCLRPG